MINFIDENIIKLYNIYMSCNKLKVKIMYFLTVMFIVTYVINMIEDYKQQETSSYNNPPYKFNISKDKINKLIVSNSLYNKCNPKKEEDDPIVTKINHLREITGLEVTGYSKYTFELSFYTDLNCENGFGNITATGKILKDGIIANNFLDFGTKVYIEGFGVKTVEDRGSKKYFNTVSKVDVFVPRNNGESDSEYYKRVNDLGRKNVDGYVLYFAD